MEEEVTQRTIALSIRTAKLTGNVLRCGSFWQHSTRKGKILISRESRRTAQLSGRASDLEAERRQPGSYRYHGDRPRPVHADRDDRAGRFPETAARIH